MVAGDDLPALREVFTAAGATGYTSVSGVEHHGFRQGRLAFNERDALTLAITVVPDPGLTGEGFGRVVRADLGVSWQFAAM